ncbi:uncharacterized protein LOC112052392 [Bicyclus anynana]|uniref:protein-tyrosine-phosphatase n=1 Tax=Bicyclus anynana TaxID=110368 RepID=A0ABM3LUY7_BICAN|nr:uncharacterized protein LOC112052392 [Bicyclus anynana]
MSRSTDIVFMTEYIKHVLYFATVRQGKILKHTNDTHYFSIDDELIYENYYSDFGPLNLGCVYKYCNILNEKLKQYLNKQRIVHYSSIDPKKKANAAFLIGCYGVLYLSLQPKDAIKPLVAYGQNYRPFQDATQGDSNYTISLLDCLQGCAKARDLNFFNFQDFNYAEYDRLDKIQGGDLNWILPCEYKMKFELNHFPCVAFLTVNIGKFLAFIGPVDYCLALYHPPEMYIDYFKENNIKIVIRLNKSLYDGNVFSNAGITHYNLFFPDGSCPPRHILLKFLQISEECDGAIAVHCKAGLGRTGSLIGCYLIKHYRMTAHEAIAWMRICRPGSVIGHQQGWLEELEPWLIKQGNLYRRRNYHDVDKMPNHDFGIYSIAEKSHQQRPLLSTKSQSPPPPIQRLSRSDSISPSARPIASKTREAANKTTEKSQRAWKETVNTGPKLPIKGASQDLSGISRRGIGAGEPRAVRPSVRNRNRIETSDRNCFRNFNVPTFPSNQTPIAVTLDEVRNILLRNSTFKRATVSSDQRSPLFSDQREKLLDSTVIVKPQYNVRGSNVLNKRPIPGTVPKITSSTYTYHTGPTQPQQRRRLGRSPSPPIIKMMNEKSRATNTAPTVEVYQNHESKTNLKGQLSRLKLIAPRHGSIGAASLGAQRGAPPDPRQAPSVRSDERPLATQGDMLNSIKFQRRLRDTITAERLEKQGISNITEKPSAGLARGRYRNPRPSSSKGRYPHPSFY